MSLVYLPVEVSRRELLARAFMSACLASLGHSSVIFRLDMFVRVGWPAPGVYIGKHYINAYPDTDLSKLESLRAAGIKVWHLDEEGGIMHGASEEEWMEVYRHYVDLTQLGPSEKILTWGEWQKEGWEGLGAKAECIITGTPNFDVYQGKYHDALADLDREQTGGRDRYVLINTRFATANALNNFGGHIIHDFSSADAVPMPERFRNVMADGCLFYKFVELVGLLATDMPEIEFILRPHPAENPDTYAALLKPLKNVTVTGEGDAGAWIRRSRCVIHNGCTTAVQAAVAGKPVITYEPDPNLSHFTAALPNSIGVRARTVDEVRTAIDNPTSAYDPGVWQRTISNLDAITTIASMVNRGAPGSEAVDITPVMRAARRFDASEFIRYVPRQILKQKREANAKAVKAFDRGFFATFPKLVEIAAGFYGIKVSLHAPAKDCFVVEPA